MFSWFLNRSVSDKRHQDRYLTQDIKIVIWQTASRSLSDTRYQDRYLTHSIKIVIWHKASRSLSDIRHQDHYLTKGIKIIIWQKASRSLSDTRHQDHYLKQGIKIFIWNKASRSLSDTRHQDRYLTQGIKIVIWNKAQDLYLTQGLKTPYSTGSSWRPLSIAYFHFTFVTFYIHLLLSPAASNVSWCWSCFVCAGLAYEIYSGGAPSMYIYSVVCYCVIETPYVIVVMSLHIITVLMMIHNSQCTMSSL